MGIFSKAIAKVSAIPIVNKVVTSKAFDTITKPIQYVGAVVANPVTAVTQSPKAALEKSYSSSFESQAGKVLLNTGTVAAAVLTGGTSVGRTAAATVGKALIPTTPKGVVTAAIAAPVAVGVLSKTTKPLEKAAAAPGALAAFGADVGTFIDEPSRINAERILTENKGVSLALGAGGLILGTGTAVKAASLVTGLQTKEAVQDLTAEIGKQKTNDIVISQPTQTTTQPVSLTDTPGGSSLPVTPQTQTLTTKPKTSRKKRRTKAPQSNISQRVNVIVSNKSTGIKQTNKKYIKGLVYA